MTKNPADKVRKVFDEAEDIPADATLPVPAPRTPSGGGGDNGGDAPQPPQDDPIKRACDQPLNDFGNGQRFVIHFGDDLMFVPRLGWFTWTGMVWEKDADELAVRSRAQQIAALIEKETSFLEPSREDRELLVEVDRLIKRRKELEALAAGDRSDTHDADLAGIATRMKALEAQLKDHRSMIGRRLTHARNAGNSGPLSHLITESQTSLAAALDTLDANPLEVNTLSGLLRFSVARDGHGSSDRTARVEVIAHARDQRQTKIINAKYDPKAKAPIFDAFLQRIQPDVEMRDFLQRWFGLSMTALTGDQKMAFFYGNGANGKSALLDLIARVLSDYCATARIESLTGNTRRGGADATPDLVPLINARMVRSSEPEKGQPLDEARIKEMTGGEPMMIRPNFGDFIESLPVFKLTLSGNHKPDIRGTDDAIWRRVMLVPFDVQIPEAERDLALVEKMFAERDGILRWMVEGLRAYLENGLAPPQSVIDATAEYRQDSDPVGEFLTSCCVISGRAEDNVAVKDLVDAYGYYQLERGQSQWKPTTVSRALAEKSKRWKHPNTGAQFTAHKASSRSYLGIRLSDVFDRRFRNAKRDASGRIIGVSEGADEDIPATKQRHNPDDFADV